MNKREKREQVSVDFKIKRPPNVLVIENNFFNN